MNQAFLTVDLLKYTTWIQFIVVFGFILCNLICSQIGHRRKVGQVQFANSIVNFPQRRKKMPAVDISFYINRFQASRELTHIGRMIILGNMLSRPGNSEHIQQLEISIIQTIEQGVDITIRNFSPISKLFLCQLHHASNIVNTIINKCQIISFRNKWDLIFQVVHSIVHGCSRKHQQFCFHPLLYNLVHHLCVTCHFTLCRIIVSEVMRLVNDNQIIIGPVDSCQVNNAGFTTFACEVSIIQYIIVESIGEENISFIVLCIDSPVVTEFFGTKHQDTIVSKFVVFDDCQSFKRLSQSYTIGNDTTSVFFNLFDGTHNTIFLKLV